MLSRFTIRTRLTLWYTAVFAATGAAVLTLMYLLVRREFFAASNDLVQTLTAGANEMLGQPYDPTDGAMTIQPVAAVEIATTASRTDALRTIVVESGITFAALAAVSLGLCWLVAGRALRPLRQITETAAVLSQDTLDARIELRGPRDEMRTLADTFDAMLDRLGQAFQAQQLFVANASHELRTPLTIIRTAAEMALSRPARTEAEYRAALDTVVAAAARSDTMLTSLLRLAQIRRAADPRPADLADLADLVTAALAVWPAHAPPMWRDLATAPCVADPAQLEVLLRNLLDNAARYNVPDGEIWIHTGTDGDRSWLRVSNTGPVIDPQDVPSLRHAFQRGNSRTGDTGAGLGLAIVDAIAAANGGHCDITPRAGGGLSVTVDFPSAA
ncbi:sensor histidine kinase [Dactylosporangium darangshiense]|uniref:histidine kinase n=1 Tax=Dactylosporangium darangshiense TaxID=579108 RepID=A0ABP8DUI8_9ACTN